MSTAFWAVFRAAVTVGSLSGIAKLVSMLKEGVVAYRFGAAPELDAFLLAYAFPLFLLNVLTGSLAAAFIPVYVRVRSSEGDAVAAAITARLTSILCLWLIGAAVVLAPAIGVLIRFTASFDEATMTLAARFLYFLMPVLVLNGMSAFWSGYLNARKRFAISALSPIATPIATMIALALMWNSLGVYAIVVGTLVGGAAELILVGSAARKEGLLFLSPRVRHGLTGTPVFPEFIAAAGGNVLIGATVLVDQTMAAGLDSGSVSVLSYGVRLTSAILSVGTMALATALLPHLSSLFAERRFDELKGLLRRYSALTLAVALPVTAGLIIYSVPISTLLFERGSFTAEDSIRVGAVQSAYALQIPFFAWSMIAVRLISAMQVNRYLVFGSAVSLILDVVLNLLLSAYMGVQGIALATSIVYAVACAYLWVMALRVFKASAVANAPPELRDD